MTTSPGKICACEAPPGLTRLTCNPSAASKERKVRPSPMLLELSPKPEATDDEYETSLPHPSSAS
eukprot:CAMPEP_0180390882 /NCGR_PEP_ID=MMETSP0989-20121125/32261_1 /TAXON_ID=697907 /ORGANISM="non described non described, Strain CCMP2293" /LENGTH=64 /DNA_ID=CAMNT_0022392345 /DNA_START=161 /DNA_END=351 /DNA_ORIENTATION=+